MLVLGGSHGKALLELLDKVPKLYSGECLGAGSAARAAALCGAASQAPASGKGSFKAALFPPPPPRSLAALLQAALWPPLPFAGQRDGVGGALAQ